MARIFGSKQQRTAFRTLLSGAFFFTFFVLGTSNATAAPIKILNNSGHAEGTIGNAINVLLGRPYTASEFVIHYTAASYGTCANDSTFAGYSPTVAISTSTSFVYCDQTFATTTPQLPYLIFSTSFTGNPGDSVSVYNQFATDDITDDYAFTNQPAPILKTPPAFYTAPGDDHFASAPGVEWKWDTTIINGNSLSGDTAANTGFMSWLRLNHPAWNWFDVKAAIRQSAANWTTGYNGANYGFGLINATTTNALADNQILLQPPEVATSTSGSYNQLNFTVYPFRQTRRVKEVLFEFPTNPGIQLGTGGNSDLTLANIQALGGTKVAGSDYSGTLATTTAPFFAPVTNAYFVWFTVDNADDTASTTHFSRIDTYSDFGPLSQPDISFNGSFDLASPANNAISASQTPTFSWNAASSYLGISKYQLYVDGTLNTDNIASTSTSTVPTGNLVSGTHTWYVKAVNGGSTSTSTVSTYTINVIPGYSSPHTFYVDNVLGNDNSVGSQTSPWATLAKAGATAEAGDTVVIIKNANTPYRENLSPTNGATFEGVDALHKPEIWGSNDVSNSQGAWTLYSGTTYQKAVATQPKIVAEGPSISSLTEITEGSSAAALTPGQWYWSSGTLYYSLQAGENITTIHIEAGARGTVISGGSATFKNIVVRYANGTGMSLNGNGQGIEVYDSFGTGINVGTGSTASYCVAVGNGSYGIQSQYSGNLSIYNSLVYGNGASGVDFDTFGGTSATVQNTISSGNTNYSFSFNYFFGAPSSFTASNNSWDIPGDSHWDTYKGTNNQELVNSLFTSTSTRDFSLQQFSPDIDAGTPIAGLTTDILGNPIYGTPDIGPYEYQPPYLMGTNRLPTTGSVRIYQNGKYRMLSATSSAATAALTVTPSGGFPTGVYSQWLDVTVNTWHTSGDYAKSWTETGGDAASVVHTVGDLAANTSYAVSVDGAAYSTATTDASGTLSFTYTSSYVGGHTFAISAVATGSIGGGGGGGGGGSIAVTTVTPTTPVATTTSATSTTSVPVSSVPTLSVHASGLTGGQVQSILAVLASFGVDPATMANVEAILTGSSSTSSAPSCSFTRDLTIGAKGGDVTCLQRSLIAEGYAIKAGATGYFGEETRGAVSAWQTALHITPPAGYFGPLSRGRWGG